MTVVVMQMHPMNIHIKANSHSGCRSGVKQTWGRLYSVIQDHINPRRVSPTRQIDIFLLVAVSQLIIDRTHLIKNECLCFQTKVSLFNMDHI